MEPTFAARVSREYAPGPTMNRNWDEYRSVMVSDRRVLMAMTVEYVYGEKIR